MNEHKENFFEERGDQVVFDERKKKRYPLVMVPKDNDFDP